MRDLTLNISFELFFHSILLLYSLSYIHKYISTVYLHSICVRSYYPLELMSGKNGIYIRDIHNSNDELLVTFFLIVYYNNCFQTKLWQISSSSHLCYYLSTEWITFDSKTQTKQKRKKCKKHFAPHFPCAERLNKWMQNIWMTYEKNECKTFGCLHLFWSPNEMLYTKGMESYKSI